MPLPHRYWSREAYAEAWQQHVELLSSNRLLVSQIVAAAAQARAAVVQSAPDGAAATALPVEPPRIA